MRHEIIERTQDFVFRRDYLYVPGFVNRVGALFTRVLPRRLVTALIARAYRKALGIPLR